VNGELKIILFLSKFVPFLKDDIVSLKVGTLARIGVEILFVVLASTGLRQAQPDNEVV
jgi:hypothetical protein